MKNQDKVIYFIHNAKSGGSSLNYFLYHFYKKNERFKHLIAEQDWEAFHHKIDKDKLKLVIGPISYGLHEYIDRPYTYFTIMRNPVKRVISFYYFIQTKPQRKQFHYILDQKIDLKDFIKDTKAKGLNNGSVRKISGIDAPFGQCTREMLEIAKRNLEKDFSVVGITERYAETLVLLKHVFGWPVFYSHKNKNPNKKKKDSSEIPEETLREIEKYNSLDIELYNYGKALFEKQIEPISKTMENEILKLNTNSFYKYKFVAKDMASKVISLQVWRDYFKNIYLQLKYKV